MNTKPVTSQSGGGPRLEVNISAEIDNVAIPTSAVELLSVKKLNRDIGK